MNNFINAFIKHEGVSLTNYQSEVVEILLEKNMTQINMAAHLFTAISTLSNNSKRVYNKFDVTSRMELQHKYTLFLKKLLED